MVKLLKNKKLIKILLQIFIYILVAYFIYDKISNNWDVLTSLKNVSYPLMGLSILIFSFHSIWNAFVWNYLINDSKKTSYPILGQFDIYLRSYLLRYIPGNVVGILARAIFNLEYKVPFLKSLFGWFYENLVYLVIGCILGAFVLIRAGERYEFFNGIPTIPIFLLIIVVGIFFSLKIDWLNFIFRKFLIPKVPAKYKENLELLKIQPTKRINLIFFYFLSWLIYSLSFLILVYAIQPEYLSTHIFELVSINALSWSLGYLSFITPSGGGVREAVMIYGLDTFLRFPDDISVIIALLARIIFIIGELIGFAGFYIFKTIYRNEQSKRN